MLHHNSTKTSIERKLLRGQGARVDIQIHESRSQLISWIINKNYWYIYSLHEQMEYSYWEISIHFSPSHIICLSFLAPKHWSLAGQPTLKRASWSSSYTLYNNRVPAFTVVVVCCISSWYLYGYVCTIDRTITLRETLFS